MAERIVQRPGKKPITVVTYDLGEYTGLPLPLQPTPETLAQLAHILQTTTERHPFCSAFRSSLTLIRQNNELLTPQSLEALLTVAEEDRGLDYPLDMMYDIASILRIILKKNPNFFTISIVERLQRYQKMLHPVEAEIFQKRFMDKIKAEKN